MLSLNMALFRSENKGLAHLGATENDKKRHKEALKSTNELRICVIRLKFYEFLHQIKVIFYLRFPPSTYLYTPHRWENANFRSKSP